MYHHWVLRTQFRLFPSLSHSTRIKDRWVISEFLIEKTIQLATHLTMLSKLSIFVATLAATGALSTAINPRDNTVVAACSTGIRCCSYLYHLALSKSEVTHTQLRWIFCKPWRNSSWLWHQSDFCESRRCHPWQGQSLDDLPDTHYENLVWLSIRFIQMSESSDTWCFSPPLCCSVVSKGMLLLVLYCCIISRIANCRFQMTLSLMTAEQ